MTLSITTLAGLQETIGEWRKRGEIIALVPTMGALHAAHLALVEEAKKHAQRVVVSIFVNPTQFGPNEDFPRYPRPLEKDLVLLKKVGADAAWLPTVEMMYPQGQVATIHIDGISEILEGVHRPGHFDGVATAVHTLFSQVAPAVAIFGEKDYQQLCLIKRLVSYFDMNIRIIGLPTLREVDGLALSSRNQYLSAQERQIAPALFAALQEAVGRIEKGETVGSVLAESAACLLAAGFRAVDYLELRQEETLAPLESYRPPARLLVAAWLGNTRLIDNIRV